LRPGLSTYWIDRADEGVRRASSGALTEPFASGNVTYLRLQGDEVVAAFDFDPDEGEADSIPLDDFLALLREWRRRVVDAGGASGVEAQQLTPETHRPMGPDHS
jgi:hypothetical protein